MQAFFTLPGKKKKIKTSSGEDFKLFKGEVNG